MSDSLTDNGRRLAALLGATILAGATPGAAWAQVVSTPTPTVATPANPEQTTAADPATQAEPDATTTGDIVVTGFRQSYADAIRSKRNEIAITDGISSDGLGRFPDLNVGEALQRVPGVQINREAEGRNATINLRGLPGEFARLTVNGVAFAEPILADAAPLGAFNSDIFSAIIIEKSPLANAQTGGLSGNVDLQIAPALSRKAGGFAKVAYEYNQLGDRGAPSATLGYNYRVSDNFAVFGVLAYKHENFRRDSIQFNSYTTLTPAQAQGNALVAGYFAPSASCTSCTGTVSTGGVIYNSQLRQYSRLNEGNLYTGAGGFEWKPTADTTFGVTGFYTDRNLPKTRQLITITSTNASSGVTALSAPVQLADGRYVVDDFSFTNPEASNSTRNFSQRQKAWGVNAKGEWKTDDWRLTAIGTLSEASNRSNENQIDFLTLQRVGGNGVTGTIRSGGGQIDNFSYMLAPVPATTSVPVSGGWTWGGVNDPTVYFDAPNPADRRTRFQLTGSQSYATNKLAGGQVDLEHFMEGGILTGIQVGARFEHNKYISEGYRTSGFGLQVQNIDANFLVQSPTAADFFGGRAGNTSMNWQITDLDYALPRLGPVTLFPGGALSPLGYNIRYNDNAYSLFNFTNQTNVASAYAQAKYEVTLAGVRIRGNGGLRYEYARNTILALDRTTLTGGIGLPSDFRQNTYKQNYDKLLPSFILVADLRDNLLLRGAAYKTYVRPQPRQFTPATIVGNPTGGVYSVTLGNPSLKPYDATSLDVSVEWYNRPNSIVSLALFQKRITGLIATIADPRQLCPTNAANLGLGTLTLNGDQCQSSLIYTGGGVPVPFIVSASGFVNQPNPVTVRGAEINVQQSLDFLPGILKNLGGGFNYAYTDISGQNLNGSAATLPGVSKHNVNMIGYYETTGYGLRLVYNLRSSYDLASAGTFTGAARSVKTRGQLDLSASLNVNSFLSLSFDAFNLTNALRLEYENDPALPRRADYDGRTYSLTARATF